MGFDIDKAREELDRIAQSAGEAIHNAIDSTGDGMNDTVAHAEEGLASGLSKLATGIDDITENTPLKGLGDKIGLSGRDLASRMERDASDHLADPYSIGE